MNVKHVIIQNSSCNFPERPKFLPATIAYIIDCSERPPWCLIYKNVVSEICSPIPFGLTVLCGFSTDWVVLCP